MVIHEADRVVARRMYQVAIGMVAAREDVSIGEYAQDALDIPTPSSIRALLAVGRGQAWLPSVIDALAEVGIAAAEDVLSNNLTHEEMMAAARPIDRRLWAEIVGRMRGGMTIHDVNALALGDDWWDVISGWVDEQRGLK